MTSTNKIIATIVIVAVILIGVGYAAINSITLNVSGSAAATASDGNFSVALTGTPDVSDTDIVTSAIVKDDRNAEFTVENISAKGETATITYTVKNNSSDLSASLSAVTSNDNTEYFSVAYSFGTEKAETVTLKAGESTTVTVTVELIKTPIDKDVSSEVGITITAQPVQPQQ